MPVVSKESVEEVRQRVSLVEVAGSYTELKKVGSQYRGLSPFTSERTPSFYVHPDKNVYFCYSSGSGGDLFDFVQRMENLGFNEAVESLALKFGVELTYRKGGLGREETSMRKRLLDLHQRAAEYYRQCFLSDDATGQAARSYWLQDRGFKAETAEAWLVGFAPADAGGLGKLLRSSGFSNAELEASGLFIRSGHERFRGRLIVPIRDIQGRVVGFTARQTELTPDDDPLREAKYVNSPETPIFQKGRLIFGLDFARRDCRGGGRLTLVEGQLDAIRCWEVGVKGAVAVQGSKLTAEQVALLKRVSDGVDCMLDGDRAGREAALRVVPLAFAGGLHVRFLELAPGCDPDDLLRSGGIEAFEAQILPGARDAWEFALGVIAPKPAELDQVTRQAALEQAFEMLRQIDSQVVLSEKIQRTAVHFRIPEEAVRADFSAFLKRHRRLTPERAGEQIADSGLEQALQLTTPQEILLYLLLHCQNFVKIILENVHNEWITGNDAASALLRRFVAEYGESGVDSVESFLRLVEGSEESAYVSRLLTTEYPMPDVRNQLQEVLRDLVGVFVDSECARITETLNNLDRNHTDFAALHQRRKELRLFKKDYQPVF